MTQLPKVSIGLPVFNGGKVLARALASLQSQTFRDFELVIADNASTDDTEMLCRTAAASDPRVRYIRHPANRGAEANFQFVLAEATAPLFMWAAADDWWSPDFLAQTVTFLDAHPDHVSATCPVRFEHGQPDPRWNGDGMLQEQDFGDRVTNFLSCWHGNSVFYSLFRRPAISASFEGVEQYLGFDWTVMLRLTRQGPSRRLDKGEMVRGDRGISSAGSIFRRYRRGLTDWVLPFGSLSREVLRLVSDQPQSVRSRVLMALASLNIAAFRAQLRYEIAART